MEKNTEDEEILIGEARRKMGDPFASGRREVTKWEDHASINSGRSSNFSWPQRNRLLKPPS